MALMIPKLHALQTGNRWPVLLAMALLPPCGGCGLASYEAKLADEQERLKEFDKDEQLLGNPLELPEKTDKSGTPFPAEVFVRPPRGIDPKSSGPLVNGFLHHYKRLGLAGDSDSPKTDQNEKTREAVYHGFRDVFLAVATDGKRDRFKQTLLNSFPGAAPVGGKEIKRARDTLAFEIWSFSGIEQPPSTSLIYACQSGKTLVALVYRVDEDKAKSVTVKETIDHSLKSLVVAPAAEQVRTSFRPRALPKMFVASSGSSGEKDTPTSIEGDPKQLPPQAQTERVIRLYKEGIEIFSSIRDATSLETAKPKWKEWARSTKGYLATNDPEAGKNAELKDVSERFAKEYERVVAIPGVLDFVEKEIRGGN